MMRKTLLLVSRSRDTVLIQYADSEVRESINRKWFEEAYRPLDPNDKEKRTMSANDVVEEVDLYVKWEAAGWRRESCGCCAGLQWGGEEPQECLTCKGDGFVWRSPKGKYALYPGGPFCG